MENHIMSQAEFTVKMRKVRETPGAILFQEVDNDGKDVDSKSGLLNTMYVRKLSFVAVPSHIVVTVQYDQK
jgi:hypothetical protein